MPTEEEIKELEQLLDNDQAQKLKALEDALDGTLPHVELEIIDTRTKKPRSVASLKEGDRVRWKVTSTFIMTTVAGQRAEVISVIPQKDGLHTNFKNLDYKGKTEHTFVVVGEISPDTYEIIPSG
jgi:hypothetical protein